MKTSNLYVVTGQADASDRVTAGWQWSLWRTLACIAGTVVLVFCTISVIATWIPVIFPEQRTNGVYPANYADMIFARATGETIETLVIAIPALAAVGYAIFSSRRLSKDCVP